MPLPRSPSPDKVQERTERLLQGQVWSIGMRRKALTPSPSPVRGRGEASEFARRVLMRSWQRTNTFSVRPST
jgi:hypothetical protein